MGVRGIPKTINLKLLTNGYADKFGKGKAKAIQGMFREARMTELEAFFNKLEEENGKLKEYVNKYSALASFVTDFDLLKAHNRLTEKEIASKAGTTQGAISRIESLKANPSYNALRKLSSAVGGRLLITPMADMTLTLPLDMHEKVAALAAAEGKSPADFMLDIIKKEVKARQEAAPEDGQQAVYG